MREQGRFDLELLYFDLTSFFEGMVFGCHDVRVLLWQT